MSRTPVVTPPDACRYTVEGGDAVNHHAKRLGRKFRHSGG